MPFYALLSVAMIAFGLAIIVFEIASNPHREGSKRLLWASTYGLAILISAAAAIAFLVDHLPTFIGGLFA